MSYELASSLLEVVFLKFSLRTKAFSKLLFESGFKTSFDPYLHALVCMRICRFLPWACFKYEHGSLTWNMCYYMCTCDTSH